MAINQYDIAQQGIQRQRGLIDTLAQQAMQQTPGRMVGQVYVGPGLLDALSKPLMGLAAGYMGNKLNGEEVANSQARQTGLMEALSGLQGKQGTPEFTTQAVGSQFPEAQMMGLKNFEAQLSPKNQESYGAPIMGANGKLYQGSNRGGLKDTGVQGYIKPENKLQITENGDGTYGLSSVDLNSGTAVPVPGVSPYVRPPAQTNINNNMPKQEGQFGKTLGQKDAERFDASNTVLANAAERSSMIDRVKALESSPVIRGAGAPFAVKAAQIGATLGIPVPENISNAEQLDAIIQTAVVKFIQQGGRGITDEEGQRMVKTWPGLLQTPEGAKKVREQMEEMNGQDIKRAKTTQSYLQQRYPEAFPGGQGGLPVDRMMQPQAPSQAAPSTGIKFLGFE